MKRLYIIRHGLAEERPDFAQTGLPDSERPLTPDGCKKVLRVGQALKSLDIQLDTLLTSPYIRALQTAQIISQCHENAPIQNVDFLYPDTNPVDSTQELKKAFLKEPNDQHIAVFGHEPQLGALVSYLLTDQVFGCFPLKKASVTCIDFVREFEAGMGQLKWSIPAKLLSRLT